jgi:protocatechuate 3,4-dioxygenase beta subunit
VKIVLFLIGAALAVGQAPAQKARITGSVIALNGEPVRKATMRLQGQPPSSYTATTGDDGKFAFEDVAPGRYTLAAEKAGFVTQRYGARPSSAAGAPLVLMAGQELKDLAMRMTPQGILSGHVSDLDGDAVPNALVSLQRYTHVRGRRQLSSIATGQTNDQGDFRIPNLAPGRYYAYARDGRALTTSQTRAATQEINVMTYYPSAPDPAGATPLDLPAGGEMRGINIQLRRGRVYAIRGKTLDPAGGGSPGGFPVELTSKESASGASTRSQSASRPADGGFEFRNLPAGTYVLRARPGNVRGPNGQVTSSNFTGRTEVTIADASLENVVLPLTQGFEISGTVKMEDGDLKKLIAPLVASSSPLATLDLLADLQEAVVRANATAGGAGGRLSVQLLESYAGTLTGLPTPALKEDGTFKFQGVGASTYLLNVTVPDGTYVKSAKFGERDVLRSPMEVSGGGTLAIVLSSKAGSVGGSVRDSKNQPLGGYVVSLWPKIAELGSASGEIKTAVTDQNGAFQFPSLAPGDYYAAAWDDLETGLQQDAEFLAHFNGDASAVKVAESGQASVQPKVIPQDRLAAEIAKLP